LLEQRPGTLVVEGVEILGRLVEQGRGVVGVELLVAHHVCVVGVEVAQLLGRVGGDRQALGALGVVLEAGVRVGEGRGVVAGTVVDVGQAPAAARSGTAATATLNLARAASNWPARISTRPSSSSL
jgi:hypothetical protein